MILMLILTLILNIIFPLSATPSTLTVFINAHRVCDFFREETWFVGRRRLPQPADFDYHPE